MTATSLLCQQVYQDQKQVRYHSSLLITLFATHTTYTTRQNIVDVLFLGINMSLSLYKKFLHTNLPGENRHHFRLRNRKVRDQFGSRREIVKNACLSKQNDPRDPSQSEESRLRMFTLEPRKKLAFCRTAKHGSSTLSNVLLQLLTRT